jgi:hypothetical protein
MYLSHSSKKGTAQSAKKGHGVSSVAASPKPAASAARQPLGAFYSCGAAAGFSPTLQAKMSNNDTDMSEDQQQDSPLQTKLAPGAASLQFKCAECEKEEQQQGEAQVQQQAQEPDSQAQEEDSEPKKTQLKEEATAAVEDDDEAMPADSTVQMWSCNDYDKPTCQIQTKEEAATEQAKTNKDEEADTDLVQAKCAACEAEKEEVQTKSATGKTGKSPPVHRVAEQGLANAHHPLPHHERIQKSFGRHDISNVRAEVGGNAGRATQKLGALAYTSGDKIGFRHTPDIKLAAHEAAHTVQQRAGLKLPGNVGTPGDRWERHADDVADAVAAGESAEPLLDSVAPSTSANSENILNANQVPASSPVVAGGDAAGGNVAGANAATPQIQNKITSDASHQTEPGIEDRKEDGAEGGAGSAGDGGDQLAEADAGAEEGAENTEEVAETQEENEPDPAADCAKAQGDKAQEPKQPDATGPAEQPAEESAGPAEMGRCYVEDAPDPPKGSEEPKGDTPPNQPEAEAKVEHGEWEEPNDECDCKAAEAIAPNAVSQQVATAGPPELSTADAQGNAGPEAPVGADGKGGEASGGGASGGTGGGGAEESSEGQFTQGEAARDAAVAEFDAATTQVDQVPDRARRLSQGLSFNAEPAGTAAEAARQAMALERISAFMQNATAQIEGAVAFVRDEAPARLGAMAEAIKASIEASMIAEKSAISERINQSRGAAIAEAAAARNTINGEYEANVASVNAETDAAVQILTGVHLASTDAISGQEETALAEVNRRFQTGRDDHDTKGTTFANAAVATGQQWANSYDACRAGPGNEYKRNNEDGFWDGCLTVRRAKAQQDAACTTAGGMAKNMVDMAKDKGFNLRNQRTQYRCAVIAGATESQTTLDSTLEGLMAGLESGRASTLDGLTKARDANLRGVDVSLQARFQSLSRQEREQRQAVNDSGYVQQVAVEQMAHQVAAGLVNSVSAAMDSLEQKLGDLREQLLGGEVPSDEQLTAVLSSAEQGLGEGVGSLLEKMEAGASEAEMSLLESGQTAASALADITSGNASLSAESDQGFSAELSTLVGAASDSMAQLADNHIGNAQESATTGADSMDQLVAGFMATTEQIYTQVDGVITTSLGELNTELTNMAEKLPGKIAGEAWRAASKEQPAWKGVLAVVLIILIIIASIVVTVLTAGAAAAALGPILGAAVLGAVVGAVSAGLIQMVNNWAAGEELTKGLVQAIVMGAVGGAIGGAIGAGANGLAQVGVNAAIKAGSSTLTRVAINVGVNLAGDMVAEGATQAFGYFAYGQKFNWQGFATAGAMSVASTARGAGGAAGKFDADASVSGMFRPTGAAGARPNLRLPTAGDAAIGLGIVAAVEGTSFLATGEFDANRFATSAAGTIAGIGAAGLGARQPHGGGDVPTARPATPDVDVPSPPKISGAQETGAVTTPKPVGTPTPPRPTAPDIDTPTAPRRAAQELDAAPTPRPAEADGPGPRRSAASQEDSSAPSRRPSETEVPTTPKPQNADTDLTRPAKELTSEELIDATKTREHLGDVEHDMYIDKNGCGVCSGCGPTKMALGKMLEGNPDTALRKKLEALLEKVKDVETRMAAGESGVKMMEDAADIAARFKEAAEQFPILGKAIDDPSLIQTKNAKGELESPPHLRDLDADVVRTEKIDVAKFNSSSIKRGEDAIYILRDKASGAILKVGTAEQGPGRFQKYLDAQGHLGRSFELEIAVVNPKGGKNIRDIEDQIRTRLEVEGHVMPWDQIHSRSSGAHRRTTPGGKLIREGRLRRSGQGTPFVNTGKKQVWTKDGNLIDVAAKKAELKALGMNREQMIAEFQRITTRSKETIERKYF